MYLTLLYSLVSVFTVFTFQLKNFYVTSNLLDVNKSIKNLKVNVVIKDILISVINIQCFTV